MLGVNKLDQLVSYYSYIHKTVKWWHKVLFWLLEVLVVNSYVIYKEQCVKQGKTPVTHLTHHRSLIDTLSEPLRTTSRVQQRLQASVQFRYFMVKGTKRKDWCCV